MSRDGGDNRPQTPNIEDQESEYAKFSDSLDNNDGTMVNKGADDKAIEGGMQEAIEAAKKGSNTLKKAWEGVMNGLEEEAQEEAEKYTERTVEETVEEGGLEDYKLGNFPTTGESQEEDPYALPTLTGSKPKEPIYEIKQPDKIKDQKIYNSTDADDGYNSGSDGESVYSEPEDLNTYDVFRSPSKNNDDGGYVEVGDEFDKEDDNTYEEVKKRSSDEETKDKKEKPKTLWQSFKDLIFGKKSEEDLQNQGGSSSWEKIKNSIRFIFASDVANSRYSSSKYSNEDDSHYAEIENMDTDKNEFVIRRKSLPELPELPEDSTYEEPIPLSQADGVNNSKEQEGVYGEVLGGGVSDNSNQYATAKAAPSDPSIKNGGDNTYDLASKDKLPNHKDAATNEGVTQEPKTQGQNKSEGSVKDTVFVGDAVAPSSQGLQQEPSKETPSQKNLGQNQDKSPKPTSEKAQQKGEFEKLIEQGKTKPSDVKQNNNSDVKQNNTGEKGTWANRMAARDAAARSSGKNRG